MIDVNNQDVTKLINLADPQAVCDEVCKLLCTEDPTVDRALVQRAFDVFAQLFSGTLPGYHRCETLYHNMHHSLEVTLACARLLAGHERNNTGKNKFGGSRLTLGIIVALFHDSGYIRRRNDRVCWHGAQYTSRHVARSGRFITQFLRDEGHEEWTRRAVKLVHFTGYEIPLDKIRMGDPVDRAMGCLIGTADLIGQMADRAYLEKCRDYLFEEFELGGLASKPNPDGSINVIYASSLDLLSKTPIFYSKMIKKRLDHEFGAAYKNLEVLFDGQNPYLDGMQRSLNYLEKHIADGNLAESLRRGV